MYMFNDFWCYFSLFSKRNWSKRFYFITQIGQKIVIGQIICITFITFLKSVAL